MKTNNKSQLYRAIICVSVVMVVLQFFAGSAFCTYCPYYCEEKAENVENAGNHALSCLDDVFEAVDALNACENGENCGDEYQDATISAGLADASLITLLATAASGPGAILAAGVCAVACIGAAVSYGWEYVDCVTNPDCSAEEEDLDDALDDLTAAQNALDAANTSLDSALDLCPEH